MVAADRRVRPSHSASTAALHPERAAERRLIREVAGLGRRYGSRTISATIRSVSASASNRSSDSAKPHAVPSPIRRPLTRISPGTPPRTAHGPPARREPLTSSTLAPERERCSQRLMCRLWLQASARQNDQIAGTADVRETPHRISRCNALAVGREPDLEDLERSDHLVNSECLIPVPAVITCTSPFRAQ